MTSQEIYAAICVYFESRGESIDGQVAVSQVIFNRCLIRHQSVKEVVFASKQFSSFNEGHPAIKDYSALVIAHSAVERARNERLRGIDFYGAEYFMNEATVMEMYGHLPSWLDGMTRVAIIGHHTFYRKN